MDEVGDKIRRHIRFISSHAGCGNSLDELLELLGVWIHVEPDSRTRSDKLTFHYTGDQRCHQGHVNPVGIWNCPECTDPILNAVRKSPNREETARWLAGFVNANWDLLTPGEREFYGVKADELLGLIQGEPVAWVPTETLEWLRLWFTNGHETANIFVMAENGEDSRPLYLGGVRERCTCGAYGHTIQFGEVVEVGDPGPDPNCPEHGTESREVDDG